MICKHSQGPTLLLTSAGNRGAEKRWSLSEVTQRVHGRAVRGAKAPQTQIRPLCHKQGHWPQYTHRWDLISAQSRRIITHLAAPVPLWVAGLPSSISMAPQNTSLSWTLLTQLRFRPPIVTWADPRFPAGSPCLGEGRLNNSACLQLQHFLSPLPHQRLHSLPLNLAVAFSRFSPRECSNFAGQKLSPSAVALQLPEYLCTKIVEFPGDFFFFDDARKACMAGCWTTNIRLV